jgi:methylmalonyl-CoA epimerase
MRLHHIAYVCKDIESKFVSLNRLFGCRKIVGPVTDEVQKVRIIFLDTGGSVPLELLEPLTPDSPVMGHLKKGGGLYHLCFEVDDLDKALEELQKDGMAMLVKAPAAAPAIDGKRVAFVVTSDKDLVELVEAKRK